MVACSEPFLFPVFICLHLKTSFVSDVLVLIASLSVLISVLPNVSSFCIPERNKNFMT
mgnify:CR=1 FL=1